MNRTVIDNPVQSLNCARWLWAPVLLFTFSCTDSTSPKQPDPDPQPEPPSQCPTGTFEWPMPTQPIAITPDPGWKNNLAWDDPFIVQPYSEQQDQMRWAKFTVLLGDPSKVYFQNGHTHRFHAEFATALLDPFMNMGLTEFNRMALHAEGQQAILGTVLFPPDVNTAEFGIQLYREEPYHPAMALQVLNLVKAAINAPAGAQMYYVPAFEQTPCAQEQQVEFAAGGFPVTSVDRWVAADSCYVNGWTVGRLQYVAGDQIGQAYANGTLLPTDILLTDRVPAEVPYVAGILTLSPSTPNSHVAILVESYGVPFGYLHGPESAARANALSGRIVGFATDGRMGDFVYTCTIDLFDLQPHATAQDIATLVTLKTPPPLTYPAKQSLGAWSRSVDEIGPADIGFFGGKASNYGVLRDVIPNHSPFAIAFSFDLWDAFMEQNHSSGPTLRQVINAQIGTVSYPPANMAELLFNLDEARRIIRWETTFSPTLQNAVEAALAPWSSTTRLRFRSSTNVEDSDSFVGAGLYDSVSGCLEDDLDGDEIGPSHCNPNKLEERGVYRAIRKVFDSFYSDNAFLERLRRGVNESEVGMAVLVHPSYPDETELANGVATMNKTQWNVNARLVSQLGAVSVANPQTAATPEVVDADIYSYGTSVEVQQPSNFIPVGATVLPWDASWPASGRNDYATLAELFDDVAEYYGPLVGKSPPFKLDFEYKRIEPDHLIIKQVRPLPPPEYGAMTPYLVGEPIELCVLQGENSTAMGIHRLKSTWSLSAHSRFLDAAGIASSFLADSSIEFQSAGSTASQNGVPSTWPSFSHGVDSESTPRSVEDSFRVESAIPKRTFALQMTIHADQPRENPTPFTTLHDMRPSLRADYDTAVADIDWQGNPVWQTSDSVDMVVCTHNGSSEGLELQERTRVIGGVSINIRFYWPPEPPGPPAGYTAPAAKWEETTISGLTTEPIVLHGYFSQSYRPEHHNFSENFVFEPRLEPGISSTILTELAAADIDLILVTWDDIIYVMGADGTLRPL